MLTLEFLAQLAEQHRAALPAQVKEFALGQTQFAFNTRPAVMGVINLSTDSWYRESVCLSAEQAIQRAHVLRAQGADIIDIGAESTLAHSARADDLIQKDKLLPVVRALGPAGILVSTETYDPTVARACLEAGANVLNLTGPDRGEEVYRLVAAHDAAVIICYVQGAHARAVGDFAWSTDPIAAMHDYFAREIDTASRQGVEKIVLDPGLGFYYRNLQDSAVRVRYQITAFLTSFRLRTLGFPICNALPHAFEYFEDEIRSAEPFFAVLAALGKTDLFRTHEVPKIKAVLKTLSSFPSTSWPL